MQVARIESPEEAEEFLLGHVDSSILLLGNLRNHGPTIGEHPNSADYFKVEDAEGVHGIFALTKRGTLLIQTDMRRNYSPLMFSAVDAGTASVQCILGNWEDSYAYLNYHKLEYKNFQLDHQSRQALYALNLEKAGVDYDDPKLKVRNLVEGDFDKWQMLREAYLLEMGFKDDLGYEERQRLFSKQCEQKNAWGGEYEGELICMSGYSSTYNDQCQIGGVFTLADYRGRQFGTKTMLSIIQDSRERGFKLMTLLTRTDNAAACRLYEGIGFKRRGYFGIFQGSLLEIGAR